MYPWTSYHHTWRTSTHSTKLGLLVDKSYPWTHLWKSQRARYRWFLLDLWRHAIIILEDLLPLCFHSARDNLSLFLILCLCWWFTILRRINGELGFELVVLGGPNVIQNLLSWRCWVILQPVSSLAAFGSSTLLLFIGNVPASGILWVYGSFSCLLATFLRCLPCISLAFSLRCTLCCSSPRPHFCHLLFTRFLLLPSFNMVM